MARKKPRAGAEIVIVNVVYKDGTQSSNRRLNGLELTGYDDDALIRRAIEEQDEKIAGLSGQTRGPIKSI